MGGFGGGSDAYLVEGFAGNNDDDTNTVYGTFIADGMNPLGAIRGKIIFKDPWGDRQTTEYVDDKYVTGDRTMTNPPQLELFEELKNEPIIISKPVQPYDPMIHVLGRAQKYDSGRVNSFKGHELLG
jgi:hypothetical protein